MGDFGNLEANKDGVVKFKFTSDLVQVGFVFLVVFCFIISRSLLDFEKFLSHLF